MRPVVRVVGLGPGSLDHLTTSTRRALLESPVVRFRTLVHPSAAEFADATSYDAFYENAGSFDELYEDIVDDLVALATEGPTGEVVYAVPGSPVVAERTVELLRGRDEVTVITEPAVSVIDLACAVLGRDPMAEGLRVVDALAPVDFAGPGPLLILQAYSPEVLAVIGERLAPESRVTVLHHLGLDDQVVTTVPARALATFDRADHLTSLWVEGERDASQAMGDLVEFVRRLRAECPWDHEQTHASLTRHLLEEAYEAIDALESLVRARAEGASDAAAVDHVEEELGDLLFQIVFHAELADEEGDFDLATMADTLRDKLVGRHPHVFGDVAVSGSSEVASRWETLKRDEKGRASVTDGIAWQLPALTLYTKLLRKAVLVDAATPDGEAALQQAVEAIRTIELPGESASDASSTSAVERAWGDALAALVEAAHFAGVDLEGVLRERAIQLRDVIQLREAREASKDPE